MRALLPLFALALLLLPQGCAGHRGGAGGRGGGAASEGSRRDGETLRLLRSFFEEWKGVPYREGGLSRRGVDCSGLVLLAFRDRFGLALPRTVRGQAGEGRRVGVRGLRPGDLVFFKTGVFRRHVGIFLEDRTFVHASTRRGVTISSLDDEYWSGRITGARRVLE